MFSMPSCHSSWVNNCIIVQGLQSIASSWSKRIATMKSLLFHEDIGILKRKKDAKKLNNMLCFN